MLRYSTLEHCEFQMIYETFQWAFSDYIVPMKPEIAQFENILLRRGYHPRLSMGAFEGDQLVGFIFSSCRMWHGEKTLYTIGVGVIPSHRGQRIAENLYLELFKMGESAGIKQYLLEVITTNFPAIKLYEKLGFHQHRTLGCFELKQALPAISLEASSALKANYSIEVAAQLPDFEISSFTDYPSSWQYSLASIKADPEGFYYVVAKENQAIIGILIADHQTGSIFQMGVAKAHRNRKLATLMLTTLKAQMPEKNFSLSNIDDRNHSLLGFMKSLEFEPVIDQYEMLKVV